MNTTLTHKISLGVMAIAVASSTLTPALATETHADIAPMTATQGTTGGVSSSQKATTLENTDRLLITFTDGLSESKQQEIVNNVAQKLYDSSNKAPTTKEVVGESLNTGTQAIDQAQTSPFNNARIVKTTVGNAVAVESSSLMNKTEQQQAINAFKEYKEVSHAEADLMIASSTASIADGNVNDTYRNTYQWNLDQIHAPSAWSMATGANQVIAVLDTGSTNHPDLNGKWVGGYDFVSGAYDRDNTPGRDADPADPGVITRGVNWHGTHVAGIAGATTDNNMGVAGVAPNAMISPVRVFGIGGTSYVSDMADGIEWASGGTVAGVPNNTNVASVINLSEAFPADTCPTSLQTAITNASSRGVPVVVAAGNTGEDATRIAPANCAGAIVVGATAQNSIMTGYSNYGAMLDILAPGGAVDAGQIFSTWNDGGDNPGNATYGFMNGTSMAAPHVAGVIAMMKEVNPSLSVEQIRSILQKTGTMTPSGYKEVNAEQAVKSALASVDGSAPTPTPTTEPTTTPTVEPTTEPTVEPTNEPTVEPTDSATPSPVETSTPTPEPSESSTPTPEPTESTEPTVEPTAPSESAEPTPEPSESTEPTSSPQPSVSPLESNTQVSSGNKDVAKNETVDNTVKTPDRSSEKIAQELGTTTQEVQSQKEEVKNAPTVDDKTPVSNALPASGATLEAKGTMPKIQTPSTSTQPSTTSNVNTPVVEVGTADTGGEMDFENPLQKASWFAVLTFGIAGVYLASKNRLQKKYKG